MRYDAKMLAKLALIFFGLLFMLCVWLGRRERTKEAPEGEKISCQDAVILLHALGVSMPGGTGTDSPEGYLTYGQYAAICRQMDGEAMGLPAFDGRYEADDGMRKEDWYEAYRMMLAYLDTEHSVWETEVFLLKIDAAGRRAYTESGAGTPYRYRSEEFEGNLFRAVKAYVKDDELLTVSETVGGEYELKNVWIAESMEGVLECFYRQTDFRVESAQTAEREQVADLVFRDGKLTSLRPKAEKVHGKLLWASQEELEIEEKGVYPVSEDLEVYKLYGSLETLARSDLKIGYEDTDYVVENGKVCACLVSRSESADRIRVLLKNTAKNSLYHDAVELEADGESIRIEAGDMKVGERRTYRCAALTDRITLHMEGSAREDNAYRGSIECCRSEEGLVLVNELPLEEYLYAVVPSEMPASYPMEALKAQAVCARTYAYLYILHAGLPELGAHVDDTTSYQVYHNCREHIASTTAVKETDGVILSYRGKPAQNYYYSTSCGVGTDAGIWKGGNAEELSYMRPALMRMPQEDVAEAEASDGLLSDTVEALDNPRNDMIETSDSLSGGMIETLDSLRDEDNFRRFITSVGAEDLEREEAWYRWIYTVENMDTDAVLARVKERYAASPESVLTLAEGGYYVSQPIEKLGVIREMEIVSRGAGGVADELRIAADTGTYKILAEYNIRSVLCDRHSEVVRQDGSGIVPTSLLPSGFFVMETGKSGESVVGYTLVGGGYGHGVGMSQNGAKALGQEGASYRRILAFFFAGCELEDIGDLAGSQTD